MFLIILIPKQIQTKYGIKYQCFKFHNFIIHVRSTFIVTPTTSVSHHSIRHAQHARNAKLSYSQSNCTYEFPRERYVCQTFEIFNNSAIVPDIILKGRYLASYSIRQMGETWLGEYSMFPIHNIYRILTSKTTHNFHARIYEFPTSDDYLLFVYLACFFIIKWDFGSVSA